MGKFRASLLSIVFQLLLTLAVFAHDDVRKVQAELRKRHLFFGSVNGQVTPALTAALLGYQAKKGFARTGLIDAETLGSLGLLTPVPRVAGTPFVVENNESVRGPNGERLPLSVTSALIDEERPIQIERATMAQDQIVPAVDASPAKRTSPTENSTKRYATSRVRRSPPRKETNPLAPALRTIDRAFKFFVGDGDPKKKRAASKRL